MTLQTVSAQTRQPSVREALQILLIGEDTAFRNQISGHLRAELGHPNILFLASKEQLDTLPDETPCDLCVIADTGDAVNCLETVDRVRRRRPDCLLLLLLEMADERLAAEATRHGVDRYIIRTAAYAPRLRAMISEMIRSAARQHRTVSSLQTSARQFQDLVENSVQGILIFQGETAVYANAALARILGYRNSREVL
ncbi:MAG: hypothetical protein WB783_21565, partial [Arenicellales bacterium]